MSVVKINLDSGFFADKLGAEKAALVPEAVVRAAESHLERFLTNHSQAFWDDLEAAVGKAIDENQAALIEAGAVAAPDEDDDEEDDGA